jgi:two-component system, OmpR family, alkaline phosphatase synthesis response regulator PhoP
VSTQPKNTVFVIEDDADISRLVRHHLEAGGYGVRAFTSAVGVISAAFHDRPALFLLDIMLPGRDGLELCREIRSTSVLAGVPVIFVTAKSSEFDRVLGLELGADDYVTKPFSLGEIIARVKARLRRSEVDLEQRDESITIGDISIDRSRQRLVVRGATVALAPKEFRLLHLLMENRGRIVTRQMLLEKVWGYDFEGEHQTISVHVRWLREKIEVDPNNPRHIITVRSRGYMFRE